MCRATLPNREVSAGCGSARDKKNIWRGVFCRLHPQEYSKTGFPNLGYMYPQGYICLSAGVHLRLAIEDKCTVYLGYILFISEYLYIHQLILLPKVICLLLNISMNNHGKLFCQDILGVSSSVEILKGYMLICRNAVGVHA